MTVLCVSVTGAFVTHQFRHDACTPRALLSPRPDSRPHVSENEGLGLTPRRVATKAHQRSARAAWRWWRRPRASSRTARGARAQTVPRAPLISFSTRLRAAHVWASFRTLSTSATAVRRWTYSLERNQTRHGHVYRGLLQGRFKFGNPTGSAQGEPRAGPHGRATPHTARRRHRTAACSSRPRSRPTELP